MAHGPQNEKDMDNQPIEFNTRHQQTDIRISERRRTVPQSEACHRAESRVEGRPKSDSDVLGLLELFTRARMPDR
jgi:hypothetical protein